MSGNQVFRQAALDRLASPEKLHTLMRVTDAKAWIALLGIALLVGTAGVWGVMGHVPTKLEASGILVHKGGLADVIALGSGQVISLEVDVGDHVNAGQVIAVVAQPELQEQIAGMEARLSELKANYQKAQVAGGRDVDLRLRASADARSSIASAIKANDERAQELEARLEKQRGLFDKGLITGERVESTQEALRSVRLNVQNLRAEAGRLDVDSFSARRNNEALLMTERLSIQDAERQLDLLRERLDGDSQVVSTHAGKVVELRTMVGDLLVPGTPIISLERIDQAGSLEALLYVDSRGGKALSPGMEVELAPSIVRKERYGVLVGTVRAVEGFPSTRRGMMRLLHNEQLVETLLQETAGAPIAVKADLTPDQASPSGYRWSSGDGPDLILTSGTRCTARVTVKTERPISLVFPSLGL